MDNDKKNTPYNDSTGDIISWVVTFICLFAFWPVGLVLLLRKLSGYAKGAKKGAKASDAGKSAPVANIKKDQRLPFEKKSGKFISVLLLLVSIALFIVGVTNIASAAGGLADGINRWPELVSGVFWLSGGLVSFFSRNITANRVGRHKKYYALVSGRDIVLISDLAKTSGLPSRRVRRDIQSMINSGYFGQAAFIDRELESLVLSAEAAEAARRVARSAKEPIRAEEPQAPENQYMAIINELRSLNNTIDDIPISDKIDRIEGLTAKIFRIVEENPEKLPQIRRFMNYYLPTTLKLLRSYATLEKQGIKGENITAAKENIRRILDTLAKGYEQQLDQLFKSDAIDISADINVLENMMQQDGLAGDRPEFKVMEEGGR